MRNPANPKYALMKIQDQTQCRRLEERKRVNLPAQMDSQGARSLAVIQDISKSGARLVANRVFTVGADTEVTLTNGIKRRGVIRRCLPIAASRKFEIGFEVTDASWPQSLLPADE